MNIKTKSDLDYYLMMYMVNKLELVRSIFWNNSGDFWSKCFSPEFTAITWDIEFNNNEARKLEERMNDNRFKHKRNDGLYEIYI